MFSPEKPGGHEIESRENEYEYDAILVLGAVMEWNKITKKWEFPPIIDRYAGKLVMGKIRAFATKEAQSIAPVILVTGGSDVNPETGKRESRSVELSRLMTDVYQIPKEKVVPMGTAEASHTLGNADNLIKYIQENPSMLIKKRIAIISPRFQAERAKMMFDINPYFQENGITLDWLIAEDIIEEKYPKFKSWADRIYSSPEAETNRKMEEKGIEDLKSGGYKPVS